MALPTMRRILGDEKAFAYFEGTLKDSKERHPFLGKSYPESAAGFATRFAEGAVGKSGRKISVKGLYRQSGRVSSISTDPNVKLRDTNRQPPTSSARQS